MDGTPHGKHINTLSNSRILKFRVHIFVSKFMERKIKLNGILNRKNEVLGSKE